MFLKECKYIEKEVIRLITEDLNFYRNFNWGGNKLMWVSFLE